MILRSMFIFETTVAVVEKLQCFAWNIHGQVLGIFLARSKVSYLSFCVGRPRLAVTRQWRSNSISLLFFCPFGFGAFRSVKNFFGALQVCSFFFYAFGSKKHVFVRGFAPFLVRRGVLVPILFPFVVSSFRSSVLSQTFILRCPREMLFASFCFILFFKI